MRAYNLTPSWRRTSADGSGRLRGIEPPRLTAEKGVKGVVRQLSGQA
jgi:hypothetical protein